MITLFNGYKSAGKISETLLVGQNIFSRNSGNEEIFDIYYDFLCSLGETLPSFADRKTFAEQASIVLAFYSENVDMDENAVDKILVCRKR